MLDRPGSVLLPVPEILLLAAILLGGQGTAPLATLTSTPTSHEVLSHERVAPRAVALRGPQVLVRTVATEPRTVVRVAKVIPGRPVRTGKPSAPPAPRPAVPDAIRTSAAPNDYPYAQATGSSVDTWGFTHRQCVSFVAWRLDQHGHRIDNRTQDWGSAHHWDDTAAKLGVRSAREPRVGDVAQWNAGEVSPYYSPGSATSDGSFVAGTYGHVAWVLAVYADGSALVEQYNVSESRTYSRMRVRAPRYLQADSLP